MQKEGNKEDKKDFEQCIISLFIPMYVQALYFIVLITTKNQLWLPLSEIEHVEKRILDIKFPNTIVLVS